MNQPSDRVCVEHCGHDPMTYDFEGACSRFVRGNSPTGWVTCGHRCFPESDRLGCAAHGFKFREDCEACESTAGEPQTDAGDRVERHEFVEPPEYSSIRDLCDQITVGNDRCGQPRDAEIHAPAPLPPFDDPAWDIAAEQRAQQIFGERKTAHAPAEPPQPDDAHKHDLACGRWVPYDEHHRRYYPDKPCSCRVLELRDCENCGLRHPHWQECAEAIVERSHKAEGNQNKVLRIVAGALRLTIQSHGAITKEWTGSAAKRVMTMLRGEGLLAAETVSPAPPTVAEMLGSDPDFTGDETTDQYMHRVRGRQAVPAPQGDSQPPCLERFETFCCGPAGHEGSHVVCLHAAAPAPLTVEQLRDSLRHVLMCSGTLNDCDSCKEAAELCQT